MGVLASALELQGGILTALLAHTPLTDIVGVKIYDEPPDGTEVPYVCYGDPTEEDWGSKSFDGTEHSIQLHCWSDHRGAKQAREILDAIYTHLHNNTASISLTGHTLVNLRYTFSDVFREPNGVTRQGVIRFRAVTHTP